MKFFMVIPSLVGLIALAFASPTPTSLASITITNSYNENKITTRNKDGVHCCWSNERGWATGQLEYLGKVVTALRALGGKISVYGHSCVQISCQGDISIVLCNDNDYYINPDANYLATYAEDIFNECHLFEGYSDASIGNYYTCGQAFDTDRYNVIVKKPDSGWCGPRK